MFYLILILHTIFDVIYPKIKCDSELHSTLTTIQKLRCAQELIHQVLKDGPLTIKTDLDFPFEAYWDASTRTVAVARTENKIHSLLFELHNASTQKQFEYYNSLVIQNKISKDEYIREIEYLEYQNTYKTAAIIDEGIRVGLFPPNTHANYSSDFEDHLCDQKSTGHSAWIGEIYDELLS